MAFPTRAELPRGPDGRYVLRGVPLLTGGAIDRLTPPQAEAFVLVTTMRLARSVAAMADTVAAALDARAAADLPLDALEDQARLLALWLEDLRRGRARLAGDERPERDGR